MPISSWPALLVAVALCLYFLVAHGCHGGDVDHELQWAPAQEIPESFDQGDFTSPVCQHR